jgi:hypothetical protein
MGNLIIEKGTIMKGIREFRVQAIAEQLKKGVCGRNLGLGSGDLRSRRMVVEGHDDLHRRLGSWFC